MHEQNKQQQQKNYKSRCPFPVVIEHLGGLRIVKKLGIFNANKFFFSQNLCILLSPHLKKCGTISGD